jgi:TRAP transporter TAXI family solute receptor
MMKKRLATLAVLMLIATVGFMPFPGYSGKALAASTDSYNITLYCGRLGMASYTLSVGLSEIVNKYSSRIRIQPMQTKANTQNIVEWSMLPKEKQMYAMGVVYPLTIWRAKRGEGSFRKPFDAPRLLALLANNGTPLWTVDPNIKSGKDLVGKRISFADRGTDLGWAYPKIAEKAWGLTPDKYKSVPTGHGPGANALIDGRLDVAMVGSVAFTATGGWEKWGPIPPSDRLLRSKKTYVVSFPEKAFKEVSEEIGFPLYPIKYEAKKHGKSDLNRFVSFNCSNSWWVSKELPEDVVTEILSIIYEHADEFAKYHALGKSVTKQSLSMTYTNKTDYHPAALKFFEGKGNKFFQDVLRSR